jgi:hypothetical protein
MTGTENPDLRSASNRSPGDSADQIGGSCIKPDGVFVTGCDNAVESALIWVAAFPSPRRHT